MHDPMEPKAALHFHLRSGRDALLWKLDGLGEGDLRMPRTPTGTNLIGIVKHMVTTGIWHFGDTFDRECPTPFERITDVDKTDAQADWHATKDETCDGIIDLYQQVWRSVDATIEELPLVSYSTQPPRVSEMKAPI